MSKMEATGYLLLAFALRCILPLVLTVLIGYLMSRISNRWEREEATARGGFTIPVPIHPACWVTRNCDPARREKCPAYQKGSMACWQARQESSGALPAECEDCPLYFPAFG